MADYSYLGAAGIVIDDYAQPQIKYTLASVTGSIDPLTGDIYSGLDLFSRIKDVRWYNYGTSTDAVRIQHGYDRASNRQWRQDPVAAANSAAFDELYAYDGLYRLKSMQRGTLNGSQTAIVGGTATFGQCWTLDATGNWKGFRDDDTGSGTWDLVQSRTANTVNEITNITNSVGSAWANPAYDPNGNMTSLPMPSAPASALTGTFDAWNRLVELVDATSGNTVQKNAYDALRRRTIKQSYTSGTLSETRHLYYSSAWQVLEERVGTSTNADRQFVWGLRYIDDLVLRDRDTTGGGTLNERFYALQDPNWNVVGLSSSSGSIQERYSYDAYGMPTFLTAAFGSRSSSSYAWETLYAGYRYDADAGLYLARNRILDPRTGSWGQRDPLEDIYASLNVYEYCSSDPFLDVDPYGLVEGYWEGVGNVLKGYGDAGVGLATGLWQMASSPLETAKGVSTSIAHPIDTYDALKSDIMEKASTTRGQGEIVGDILIGIATGGALKSAQKAGYVAKIANKSRVVANTLKNATVLRPISKTLGSAARRTGKASSRARKCLRTIWEDRSTFNASKDFFKRWKWLLGDDHGLSQEHLIIKQRWYRGKKPLFPRGTVGNKILQGLGDAGWNLMVIPEPLNRYLYQHVVLSAMFSGGVYGGGIASIYAAFTVGEVIGEFVFGDDE
jgi:RHS repeat-associated protein